MNVLICGDSFAADWTNVQSDYTGWPALLAQRYTVTNLAQAGCSEYKILQQVKLANLAKFDAIIVSHTSPNRIYCKEHPFHQSVLHKNADLIYSDVEARADLPDAKLALDFFNRYFDLDHARDISNLICNEICNIISQTDINQFHIVTSTDPAEYPNLPSYNITSLFNSHRGVTNHLNKVGNNKMFNIVDHWLNTVL